MVTENTTSPINCACVIHGNTYDWTYVERLYNMLSRHLNQPVQFHVYTEHHRPVPAPMIKHSLDNWQIGGPRQSWWYKIQLFNPQHFSGPLLYFDLDVVIVDNIDWICKLPANYFWAVQDFKYLWRANSQEINSSIMWWDTQQFSYVWEDFQRHDLKALMKRYRGDQDYLSKTVDRSQTRFLDPEKIVSWRWQCLEGGYKNNKRVPLSNHNTILPHQADVLVFHGQPKPNQVTDPVIQQHWK